MAQRLPLHMLDLQRFGSSRPQSQLAVFAQPARLHPTVPKQARLASRSERVRSLPPQLYILLLGREIQLCALCRVQSLFQDMGHIPSVAFSELSSAVSALLSSVALISSLSAFDAAALCPLLEGHVQASLLDRPPDLLRLTGPVARGGAVAG